MCNRNAELLRLVRATFDISFAALLNRQSLNTTFRQAFLLRQYSFICVQYFKFSDT